MFTQTITVFNRYHNSKGDTWYPHILDNVEVNVDKASIVAKYGIETSDTAGLHVRYDNKDGQIYVNGLRYLPPKEWAKQVNDDLGNTITFNDDAQNGDFFIIGEYPDLTPILDEDFKKGFYNELNTKLDYCYSITSVGIYKLIPHFEIMAK